MVATQAERFLRRRMPRIAVCFLAFDRHRLVRLTLDRVLRFKPSAWPLRVWQDGHQERYCGRIVGDARRIARNLEFFERSGVAVDYEPGINRGIAHSYWAAERWAFEAVGADACIFVEDDIVISRHFFTMMASLARLALRDQRIGAFSAFGDAASDWRTQWRLRQKFQPMHHRWGYGITRDYWLRTQADYRHYLSLFEGLDYRNRPSEVIRDWIDSLGGAEAVRNISSQDGARTAIMLNLGCFSIMTTPCYALNIGKRGLHFDPLFFQQNKDQMKGRHGFFPLPVRLPFSLPRASEALNQESGRHSYW